MANIFLKKKAVFVWSGGKDSALALYQILQDANYQVTHLLTTVNQQLNRVTMHGVRTSLLAQQAQALQLPLVQVRVPENPSMAEYEQVMAAAFQQLKDTGVTVAVFGDIFLEDLRAYREQQMQQIGLQAVFPLWQKSTTALINQFVQLKFKAVLVCLHAAYFPETYAGQEINADFLKNLPASVDPCGENGEYHSFVYDGPIFGHPVNFTRGETLLRTYAPPKNQSTENTADPDPPYSFWFIDLK
ncbi:Dph6-related ATP pyrophosphatase [Adhaeribacter pallidiroseus]|uniref:Diphthine--ammonia ligase n=1 Tax=Adhaeribacter pallidiroseus TaxID=2072847 RepID=A0A369QNQ5_9BACT|nr:diphthine--ammonia ligase [Adhaeribacter pallidiroseus]RDC66513.1 Diphthine--ammonia ligase [Adhaeribacter pallidiroseus]